MLIIILLFALQTTTSLSFFLFSFHVHEKTILLVTLPASLLITHHPCIAVWFNVVAGFSMYPLLVREGLSLPLWGIAGFYIVVALFSIFHHSKNRPSSWKAIIVSLVTFMSLLWVLSKEQATVN